MATGDSWWPAIAEVGENPYQAPYDEGYAEGVRVTIERCAQVAEQHHCIEPYEVQNEIAAAIRALKND